MANIFKTEAGWVKRLPDGNLGPFKTKTEAEKAYKTAAKPEKTKKVVEKTEPKKVEKVVEKKIESIETAFKEDKKD